MIVATVKREHKCLEVVLIRERLVKLQNHGMTMSPLLSGTAFVACPLLLLVTAAPIRGDAWRLVVAAAALVLFAVGLTGLRQLETGLGLPTILTAAAIISITAEVVGTLFEVSGVAIAVPLLAALAVVLYTSRWRVGDLSLIGFALGLGSGLAYVLDNIVHDDNGSATDQAVPLLVLPSIALALGALARTRSITKTTRICVSLGAVLALGALIVALATEDNTFVVIAVPAGSLLGFGLAATGIRLIRLGTASSKQNSEREHSRYD